MRTSLGLRIARTHTHSHPITTQNTGLAMALSEWNLSFMRKYYKNTQDGYSRRHLNIKFVDFGTHLPSDGLDFFVVKKALISACRFILKGHMIALIEKTPNTATEVFRVNNVITGGVSS